MLVFYLLENACAVDMKYKDCENIDGRRGNVEVTSCTEIDFRKLWYIP